MSVEKRLQSEGDVKTAPLTRGQLNAQESAGDLCYSDTDVSKGADHGEASGGSWFAKRYLKGDVAIHLHCNLRAVVGDGVMGDFCLTFKRAEVGRDRVSAVL